MPPVTQPSVTWNRTLAVPDVTPFMPSWKNNSCYIDVVEVALSRIVHDYPMNHATLQLLPIQARGPLPAAGQAMINMAQGLDAVASGDVNPRLRTATQGHIDSVRDQWRLNFGALVTGGPGGHPAIPDVLNVACQPLTRNEIAGAAIMATYIGRTYEVAVTCQRCSATDTLKTMEHMHNGDSCHVPRMLSTCFTQEEDDGKTLKELIEQAITEHAAYLPAEIVDSIRAKFAASHGCTAGGTTADVTVTGVTLDKNAPCFFVDIQAPFDESNMPLAQNKMKDAEYLALDDGMYELLAVFYRRVHNRVKHFMLDARWNQDRVVHYDNLRKEIANLRKPEKPGEPRPWAFLARPDRRLPQNEMWNVVGVMYKRM